MSRLSTSLTLVLFQLGFSACAAYPQQSLKSNRATPFPAPARPVASVVSPRWSTEKERDRYGEAEQVMQKADIRTGMAVADIGAGEGYYTVRIARRVGRQGKVLAEDIDANTRDALALRVSRERLENVEVLLGETADPKLPVDKLDRVLMVHMYHEFAQPYELLWRMRPSLRSNGEVDVVDADRPTQNHGTPPALLKCEFARVGYQLISLQDVPAAGGYLARFRAVGPRPDPATIKACGPQ